MSLVVLALGVLTADPQERTATGGTAYVTANLRTQTDEHPVLVSVVALSGSAKAALLALGKGDSMSVTGRAKLTAWTGREGEQRQGLRVVADGVLSASTITRRRTQAAAAARTSAEPDGATLTPLHA